MELRDWIVMWMCSSVEPKLIQYRRRLEILQLRFLPATVGRNLNATGHKRLYGSTHPLNNNKAITEYNI